MQIIDISELKAPKVGASVPADDFANYVAYKGDFVYVSDAKAGVKKIDIKDPLMPMAAASFDTSGYPNFSS